MEKLVRDKIPELMRASGIEPTIRRAQPDELLSLLLHKLREEVEELQGSPGLEELVDVAEVMGRICKELGIQPSELHEAREKKANVRGRFDAGIVLIIN